jgi:O-antigen/teichoic acid export membrane protein
LQQVIGNTGWLFAEKILRMGVGLPVTIWVTRYLGPELFGLLNYAIAFVTIFSSISIMLSLDAIVVRTIVRNPSSREETLGSAFVLKFSGGAIAFGITLAAVVLFRPADRTTQMLVGIIAFGTLFQPFGVIDSWFQSQVQSKYAALARTAAYMINCGAKVVLILAHAPLMAFAWTAVADIVLSSLGLVIVYRIKGQYLKAWRATRAMLRDLLRDTWPLILSEIVIMIYMRADKILLGDMAGNTELGIYSAATLVAEAFYFIPTVVCSSVFPALVRSERESEELFHERLQYIYNLMALLGYAVALPVTFLAVWAMPFMFGAVYSKAGPMLVGLVWAGLFINLNTARSYYLTAVNWTRLHLVTDILCAVVNVLLNILLIPRYGGMGAVIASLVSYWFLAHGMCFIFKPLSRTGIMMTRALVYPKIW